MVPDEPVGSGCSVTGVSIALLGARVIKYELRGFISSVAHRERRNPASALFMRFDLSGLL